MLVGMTGDGELHRPRCTYTCGGEGLLSKRLAQHQVGRVAFFAIRQLVVIVESILIIGKK